MVKKTTVYEQQLKTPGKLLTVGKGKTTAKTTATVSTITGTTPTVTVSPTGAITPGGKQKAALLPTGNVTLGGGKISQETWDNYVTGKAVSAQAKSVIDAWVAATKKPPLKTKPTMPAKTWKALGERYKGTAPTPLATPKQVRPKAKLKTTATKKTLQWQKDYQQDILALLKPYQQAVGQLPKEYNQYISQLEKAPTATIPGADEIASQLMQQYSPHTFGAAATPTLATTESQALSTSQAGTAKEAGALTTLGKGMTLYMQAAPYEAINKALLGRIQSNTMYGTTPLPAGKGWPVYLKTLYNVAVGGAGVSGKTLSVAGLGKVSKATTQTATTPAGGATTGP